MAEPFGLIFDMDGVLADTEALIARASIAMFRELYGLELEPEDFCPYIGTGAVRYVEGPAEDAGIQLRDLDEAIEKRHQNFGALLEAGECKPCPGALELVHAVAATNGAWKLAIATSSPLDKFDVIVNGDMVTHKKPHPEIYLKTAEELGLPPARCIVVEDAVSGVQSAKAAGMQCIAVTSSFSKEDLAAADAIVASLEEVTVETLRGMVG